MWLIQIRWHKNVRIVKLLKGASHIIAQKLHLSTKAFWFRYGMFICHVLLDHGPIIVLGIFGRNMNSWDKTTGLTPDTLSLHLAALLGEKLPESLQEKFLKQFSQRRLDDNIMTLPTPLGLYLACAARGGSISMFKEALKRADADLNTDISKLLTHKVVNAAIINGRQDFMDEIEQWHTIGEGCNRGDKSYEYQSFLLAARYSPTWLQRIAIHGYPTVGWDGPKGKPSQLELKNRILHEAARSGQIDALKLYGLNRRGLNSLRHGHLTLLGSAASEGRLATMRWLLDNGATDLECGMLMAAARGYIRAVQMLMGAGFDVHAKPMLGALLGVTPVERRTSLRPVVLAAEEGMFEVVEFFLQVGCQISAPELRRARHQLTHFNRPYAKAMSTLLGRFPRCSQDMGN